MLGSRTSALRRSERFGFFRCDADAHFGPPPTTIAQMPAALVVRANIRPSRPRRRGRRSRREPVAKMYCPCGEGEELWGSSGSTVGATGGASSITTRRARSSASGSRTVRLAGACWSARTWARPGPSGSSPSPSWRTPPSEIALAAFSTKFRHRRSGHPADAPTPRPALHNTCRTDATHDSPDGLDRDRAQLRRYGLPKSSDGTCPSYVGDAL